MYTTTIFLVYCKLDSCPFPLRKRKNKADFHHWKNDFAIIGGSFVFTVELLSENGIMLRGAKRHGAFVYRRSTKFTLDRANKTQKYFSFCDSVDATKNASMLCMCWFGYFE
jgi:hypothetical protein